MLSPSSQQDGDEAEPPGEEGESVALLVHSFRALTSFDGTDWAPSEAKTVVTAPAKKPWLWQRITWTTDILAVSIVYMVEGFTDLAGTSVQYYLKDDLGLGPAQAGIAYAVALVPWNMMPVLGLVTDLCPIFGYHRKAYLLLVGLAGSACWLLLPGLTSCVPVTLAVLVANACSAWSQVVGDAVTVKLSQRQPLEVAAFFQSISWVTYTVGALIGSPITGWVLEQHGAPPMFWIMAACMLVVALCGLLISEQPEAQPPPDKPDRLLGAQLSGAVSASATPSPAPLPRQQQHSTSRWVGHQPPLSTASPAALRVQKGKRYHAAGTTDEDAVSLIPACLGHTSSGGDDCGSAQHGLAQVGCPESPISPTRRRISPRSSGVGVGYGDAAGGNQPGVQDGASTCRQQWSRHVHMHEQANGATARTGGGGRSGIWQGVLRSETWAKLKGVWRRVAGLLWEVWLTLKQPHIGGSAAFIFLWQCTPAPTSAMFYFQTNVLAFSPNFIEFMYVCGTLSGFLGVMVYNLLLVRCSLRGVLLWAALLGNLLNASQLLLVSRWNLKLGLSDELFSLGDYSMLSVLAEVMMTPMLALASRVCPDGIEATLSATLYSLLNLSRAISAASGAALTAVYGVTDTNFDHMFGLTLICNLLMFAPLPLLLMVPPDSGAPEEDKDAAAAEDEGNEGGSTYDDECDEGGCDGGSNEAEYDGGFQDDGAARDHAEGPGGGLSTVPVGGASCERVWPAGPLTEASVHAPPQQPDHSVRKHQRAGQGAPGSAAGLFSAHTPPSSHGGAGGAGGSVHKSGSAGPPKECQLSPSSTLLDMSSPAVAQQGLLSSSFSGSHRRHGLGSRLAAALTCNGDADASQVVQGVQGAGKEGLWEQEQRHEEKG